MGQPDLIATNLTFDGEAASFRVQNIGTANAGDSIGAFFLSHDPIVTSADTGVTGSFTGTLAPSASFTVSDSSFAETVRVLSLPLGVYYLGGLADESGVVAESNENNNASSVLKLLLGDGANNGIVGTGGNDIILGLGGNDTITAGAGNDVLNGGPGSDTFRFAADQLTSADIVYGGTQGTGVDRIVFHAPGTVAADAFAHVHNVLDIVLAAGTNHLTLSGSSAPPYVYGSSGDDTIDASGAGPMFIFAGTGNDTLIGSSGSDTFHFATAALTGADNVNGGPGANRLDTLAIDTGGTITADALAGVTHVERIAFTNSASHAVTLTDALVESSDRFVGLAHTPIFYVLGNAGRDSIYANQLTGTGIVQFEGFGGPDRFVGGPEDDRIVLSGVSDSTGDANGTLFDTIVHFDTANDVFVFSTARPTAVSTVDGGALSAGTGTFDSDLAAAVGSQLAAHTAVLFHATGGNLSGYDFLVVNPTNSAGYVSGADYVFDVTTHTGSFTTSDFV